MKKNKNNKKKGSTFIDATFGIIITSLIVMLLYKSNIFTKKHEAKNIKDLNSNIQLSNMINYLYAQKSWENIENHFDEEYNFSYRYKGENEYGLDVVEIYDNDEVVLSLEKFNYEKE